MRALTALPLLLLGACVHSNWYVEKPLWDAEVVATTDGAYVMLPHSGRLVHVKDNGTWREVDLEGAQPTRIVASPDGERVLVFARWRECEDPEVTRASDCDGEDLSWNNELAVVKEGKRDFKKGLEPHMNAVAFSADGAIAVAYLDYETADDLEIEGVADLGEVRFINLIDESDGSASVGFSPNKVLFSADNAAAVVMSRSKVVKVDLSTFEKVLEAPLTLDADAQVDPSGAVLTPDGSTLLITVQGSSDLYMLDLDTVYWNIGSLGDVPATLDVDPVTNKSVFVFGDQPEVNVLNNTELDVFSQESVESVSLEEPANQIRMGEGAALLYNVSSQNYHDVYRLDLENLDLVEYVVDNPVSQMRLTDSGRYAVGILRPEAASGSGEDAFQDGRWGLAVLDMNSEESVSLVAESEPVGLALVEDEDSAYALALLESQEYLLRIDLEEPSGYEPIELPAPPLSISAMPDGRFLIAHAAPLGLISFLDPENPDDPVSVGGFATAALLDDDDLPRRGNGD